METITISNEYSHSISHAGLRPAPGRPGCFEEVPAPLGVGDRVYDRWNSPGVITAMLTTDGGRTRDVASVKFDGGGHAERLVDELRHEAPPKIIQVRDYVESPAPQKPTDAEALAAAEKALQSVPEHPAEDATAEHLELEEINGKCLRCGAPAFTGLFSSKCLRSGGCSTAEERVAKRMPLIVCRTRWDQARGFAGEYVNEHEYRHDLPVHADGVARYVWFPSTATALADWRERALAGERAR